MALSAASPRVVRPPCPHFGRCGGCQWQHLEYPAQLEQKTALVSEALERGGLRGRPIAPAIGWEPSWEFRAHLEAAVGVRDGRRVLGFFSWGGDRIIEVGQCPVQHPGNVAALTSVRAAWDALHPIGGVDDLDVDAAEEAGHRVPRQLRFDRGAVSHEQQPDLEVPRRDQRAIDDDGRPGVAAHGVDRDTHKTAGSCQLAAVSLCVLKAGSWKLEAILRPP